MKISLRKQIFLWYLLVIPVIVGMLAFTAQQIMVNGMRKAIDQRLQQRVEIVTSAVVSRSVIKEEINYDLSYDALIQSLTERVLPYVPAILRIGDPQGKLIASFGDIPGHLVPVMNRHLVSPVSDEGRFETINIRGREALRLYTVPVRDPETGKQILLIQTGDSLAAVAGTQEQLWRYTLGVGTLGTIVALLIVFFLLKKGFQPLERILSLVHGIGSKNLTARIPGENRPPELQQLADTLNSLLQRLDAAFRTREVLVASVSHDFKTPLTILQGEIDVMLMCSSINPDTRQSLELMATQVRRLTRMTSNLLLSAQLEVTPKITLESVDLSELLREVLREAKVLAPGRELKVSIPETVVVFGDYDLLTQMVLNVLDNAFKFTPDTVPIEISLSYLEDRAIISVSDSGNGIPHEILSNIGKLFVRSGMHAKLPRGGAGLGLGIVKKIIELHGGNLEIHSQAGAGAIVSMQLRLKQSAVGGSVDV